ncbi:MAG: hypothetical protein BHV96_05470 [Clostridium sp. CAG:354_28_25]|jgi:hypothetical protein|nr:MAG: hypothetical protein BHV96_05470 [Clostridium sp. CAG:354_28_25]
MTKEQAIEKCKKIINTNNKVVKEARRVRDINTMNLVANLDDESIAIETVLNMLKEKDVEIEKLKKDFKIVDEECSRLERKEAKQDKMIDLMAERINWLCKTNGILLDKEHGVNFDEKDIKQYFERKVEYGR